MRKIHEHTQEHRNVPYHPGWGYTRLPEPIWYNPKVISNILSMDWVEKFPNNKWEGKMILCT